MKELFNLLLQNIKDMFIESVCLISFFICYLIWKDNTSLIGLIISGSAFLVSSIIHLIRYYKHNKKTCSEEYMSKFQDIYFIYVNLFGPEQELFYELFKRYEVAKTTKEFPDPAWSDKFKEITRIDLEDDNSKKLIDCQITFDETNTYYLFKLKNGVRRYYTKRLVKKVIKYYNKNI